MNNIIEIMVTDNKIMIVLVLNKVPNMLPLKNVDHNHYMNL